MRVDYFYPGLEAAYRNVKRVRTCLYEPNDMFTGVDVSVIGNMSDVLMGTIAVWLADVRDLVAHHTTKPCGGYTEPDWSA